jgi:hypothetical protein
MRKDVILGMSIGGVLLAIVITYLTFSPNKPKGVDLGKDSLVSESGNSETSDGQGQQQGESKPAASAEASRDSAHGANLGANSGANSGGSAAAAAPSPAKSGAAGAVAAKPKGDDTDWAKRRGSRPRAGQARRRRGPHCRRLRLRCRYTGRRGEHAYACGAEGGDALLDRRRGVRERQLLPVHPPGQPEPESEPDASRDYDQPA